VEKDNLKSMLYLTNFFLGALIFILSIFYLIKNKSVVPYLISFGILLVGPVEDALMKMVAPDDRWIIDQLTSIGMLIFLLSAVVQSQKE